MSGVFGISDAFGAEMFQLQNQFYGQNSLANYQQGLGSGLQNCQFYNPYANAVTQLQQMPDAE